MPLLACSIQSTPQVLAQEQVQQLIEVAEGRISRTAARDRAILHLLVHVGLRAGEIIFLQVNDIDFAQDTAILTIREQGKTPERRLPLNTAARAALQNYLDQRRSPEAGCPYLFCGRDGVSLSIRSVQQIVASLGKAAGLDITAKVLRDTYAREFWRVTSDLELLIQRLGVRRPETALKYIAARSDNGLASTMNTQPTFGAAG